MRVQRSGRPWTLTALAALPALAGCAPFVMHQERVYVSLDRLLERHSALVSLAELPGSRIRRVVPEPGPIQSYRELPEPLKPLRNGNAEGQAEEKDDNDASSSERLVALEASMQARADAAKARDVRLMRSALASERAQAMREAEERISSKQNTLERKARPRLRDLDLRILALTAQRGSLAAGPPDDVEQALRDAKAARRQIEARLTSEIASFRNAEYAAVRGRIEEREADIEREIGIADAARRREIQIALRRHREALAATGRSLPRETQEPRTERHEASARLAPSRGVAGWTDVRAAPYREAHVGDAAKLVRSVRQQALRDLREHVSRICAERGWVPVFAPRPGAPDRTMEIARALLKDGLLQ